MSPLKCWLTIWNIHFPLVILKQKNTNLKSEIYALVYFKIRFKRLWYVLLKNKEKKPNHTFPEYLLFPCLQKQNNSFLPCRDNIIGMYAGWQEGAIVGKEPANNTLPIHWPGIPPTMQKPLAPLPLACFHGRSNVKETKAMPAAFCSQINISASRRKSILGQYLKSSSPQYKTCSL